MTSSGREFVVKLGLWALTIELESPLLDTHLNQLIEKLPHGIVLTSVLGVDDAYVDVFVALASDSEGEANGEFDISPKVLGTLAQLGLPVRLTLTAGQD